MDEDTQESIPQFKELDDVLNCGICHEILTTPVITACSHTYCSICIRRWLSGKQECPSCATAIYESTLRKNTIVGNILDAVKNVKRLLGKNASMPSIKSSTRCLNVQDEFGDEPKNRTIKTTPPATPKQNHSAQPTKTPMLLPKTPSPMVQKFPKVEVNSTPGGGTPTALDNDHSPAFKVPCPVCGTIMAQRLVNSHLDRCLLEPKTRSSETVKSPTPTVNSAAKTSIAKSSNSAESNPSLQPIKKMVYNLLSDKQIKNELRKYGLAIQGDRSTLLSRLKRFVILHNAECDSTTPKTLSEMKLLVEREEKAMAGSSASSFSQMFKRTDNPQEIDNALKEYRTQQKASYQKLIDEVKKRNKHKPSKKEECVILSDTEDEDDPAPIPVPQHEPLPVPESAHAMNSRQADSDCDKSGKKTNHGNASDSDDIACTSKSRKSTNHRKMTKNVKRKCIESESEEDEGENEIRQAKQWKRAEQTTSPVLPRSTPARQLRSRTAQNKAIQKRSVSSPQSQTRNSQRIKQPPSKKVLERGGGKDGLSSSSDEEIPSKRSIGVKQSKQRSPTPDPDIFESSPASSILFPCGQKARCDDSGNEALSALVNMIDNDGGSTTDFDE
ncbi:E3 ubiquitin-protein ligase RAD18-like isoform X1 [Thrips palmi]|uniref:RING-type E3 ubiquitin transferase n=1 Tax=Thrips palmi TaxID=161013 RepID=A0A6P9AMU4_THRPL|nr:E3 ubiquitin-protein ligase RAD18-like isoform X1 [Thrips palmi]